MNDVVRRTSHRRAVKIVANMPAEFSKMPHHHKTSVLPWTTSPSISFTCSVDLTDTHLIDIPMIQCISLRQQLHAVIRPPRPALRHGSRRTNNNASRHRHITDNKDSPRNKRPKTKRRGTKHLTLILDHTRTEEDTLRR